MPYKDLERKKEWEQLHRPDPTGTEPNFAGFLIPLVAGGALAAYNPKLGMAAGGGMLAIAAIFKKGTDLGARAIFLLERTKYTARGKK